MPTQRPDRAAHWRSPCTNDTWGEDWSDESTRSFLECRGEGAFDCSRIDGLYFQYRWSARGQSSATHGGGGISFGYSIACGARCDTWFPHYLSYSIGSGSHFWPCVGRRGSAFDSWGSGASRRTLDFLAYGRCCAWSSLGSCSRRLRRRYLSHFSDGCSCGAWLSRKRFYC